MIIFRHLPLQPFAPFSVTDDERRIIYHLTPLKFRFSLRVFFPVEGVLLLLPRFISKLLIRETIPITHSMHDGAAESSYYVLVCEALHCEWWVESCVHEAPHSTARLIPGPTPPSVHCAHSATSCLAKDTQLGLSAITCGGVE